MEQGLISAQSSIIINAKDPLTEMIEEELKNSAAFSLLNDLTQANRLDESSSDFLRAHYKKLYIIVAKLREREKTVAKKNRLLHNDILADKINFEKVKSDETEAYNNLRKTESMKDLNQKEFDSTEQKVVMTGFELTELKKLHDDLTQTLKKNQNENKDIVFPIFQALTKESESLEKQQVEADNAYTKELEHKALLMKRLEDLEAHKVAREAEAECLVSKVTSAQFEPGRLSRQSETMTKASANMVKELDTLKKRLAAHDIELEKQRRRKEEALAIQHALEAKLDQHKRVMEEKEAEVTVIRAKSDMEKAKNHDLITRKLETNIQKKGIDTDLRFATGQSMFVKKEYEGLKRFYRKKLTILDSVRQMLPLLQVKLDLETEHLDAAKKEEDNIKENITRLKDELDELMGRFIEAATYEQKNKEGLEEVVGAVDDLDGVVAHLLAEEKRQGKLISVLSSHRDIKARESARVSQKERETRQHVRMKELVVLDLTKRCNEISNRLKEFSALYEVVKNERNKYVGLIQGSAQALSEMREKIRILQNEYQILLNESQTKDAALTKERSAHFQAQNQRESLRQEMNKVLSEYRQKQGVVEQQIQEVDKLNLVINDMEREMILLKENHDRATAERNSIGAKLIDRNDELCVLYERSKHQSEFLEKGEAVLKDKEEELRTLRLQSEELQRQFKAAVNRVPEVAAAKLKLKQLDDMLKEERLMTDEMGSKLEDTTSNERFRKLEGEDASEERLQAKLLVLEESLNKKRETSFEKGIVLEEVTMLTEKLRGQAVGRRDAAKSMAEQLNHLQTRIRETTKKMLGAVSELSMYQATALRLQQEKLKREKNLEEAKWRADHGDAPDEEVVAEFARMERKRAQLAALTAKREEELRMDAPLTMSKTTADPRPTAYIPDEIGIPKPYGALAPFKPSELGSSMRHIRPPQPKPIEL